MLTQTFSRFTTLIGWPGGIGLALLFAAIVMSVNLSLPIRKENISLKNEIKYASELSGQKSNVMTATEVRKKLNDFVETLPRHDEINDTLNQLHDLAASHHLSLKNSEYRPSNNKSDSLRQLRITVKTEGSYSDLRSFLKETKIAIPSLVIEQVAMTRQKISDTRLDTVVEFDLFYFQTDLKHT